jgi:hemolysin
MKIKLLIAIGAVSCVCNVMASHTLGTNSPYIYINMNNYAQQSLSEQNGADLAIIQDDILKNNKAYLIDFSQIKSSLDNVSAKQHFYHSSAASFNDNRILISNYKNGLLFTPVDDNNLQAAIKSLDKLRLTNSKYLNQNAEDPKNPPPPMIVFRIHVVRPITTAECTFPTNFGKDDNYPHDRADNFCKDPEMDLIYTVSLARSLPGTGGVDAKIADITLASQASGGGGAGNGIRLNDTFKLLHLKETDAHMRLWNTIWKFYSHSAIAQYYKFAISTADKKTIFLGGYPDNQNMDYRNTLMHVTTFGINAKPTGTIGEDAIIPSFDMGGSASYAHTHRLTFNSLDYAIRRSGGENGENGAIFEWYRDRFNTADSLLDMRTSSAWHDYVIESANLSRVKPIAYSGFIPNLRTTFMPEADNINGKTTFNITSSVRVRPVYAYGKQQTVPPAAWWQYYNGTEHEEQWNTISDLKSFTVNWSHPVFLGGWPVILQLKDFGRCLNIVLQSRVSNNRCNLNDIKQSFLYDKQLRYRSVTDISMCLDADNLTRLAKCSDQPSQKWVWKDKLLRNAHAKGKVLAYKKDDGSLYLFDQPNTVSNDYSTNFGSIFNKIIE